MALSMTLYRSIYIFKDFPTPRNEREAIITYENEIQDYQPKNVRYMPGYLNMYSGELITVPCIELHVISLKHFWEFVLLY